jgi:hypothetical protein
LILIQQLDLQLMVRIIVKKNVLKYQSLFGNV